MRSLYQTKLALGCIWLATSGCGDSTDALITQLGDPDPAIRRQSAQALANTRGDVTQVVAALASALNDADLEVRELAASSLGRIGPKARDGLPALEQALAAPEPSVRLTAALA